MRTLYYDRSSSHSGSRAKVKVKQSERERCQFLEGWNIMSRNPTAEQLLYKLTRLTPRSQRWFIKGVCARRKNAQRA